MLRFNQVAWQGVDMTLSLISKGPNGKETLHLVSSPEEAIAKYKKLEAAGYQVVIQDDDGKRKHNGQGW